MLFCGHLTRQLHLKQEQMKQDDSANKPKKFCHKLLLFIALLPRLHSQLQTFCTTFGTMTLIFNLILSSKRSGRGSCVLFHSKAHQGNFMFSGEKAQFKLFLSLSFSLTTTTTTRWKNR